MLIRIDEEITQEYQKYILLILKRYKKNIYLSKNNNNILRLSNIIKSFPNSKIIIPFRNPIQQAYSLLNQHKNFLNLQRSNSFINHYMSFLVHHEFGKDHRPFLFKEYNG